MIEPDSNSTWNASHRAYLTHHSNSLRELLSWAQNWLFNLPKEDCFSKAEPKSKVTQPGKRTSSWVRETVIITLILSRGHEKFSREKLGQMFWFG